MVNTRIDIRVSNRISKHGINSLFTYTFSTFSLRKTEYQSSTYQSRFLIESEFKRRFISLQEVVNYEHDSSNDSFGNSKGPSHYYVRSVVDGKSCNEALRSLESLEKTNQCLRLHRGRVMISLVHRINLILPCSETTTTKR